MSGPGCSRASLRSLRLFLPILTLTWVGCSSAGDATVPIEWDAMVPPPPPPLPTDFRACVGIGATGDARSALSPDGRDLAIATGSGQLILLDPESGERKRTIWDLHGAMTTVVFSRRGDVLIAATGKEVRAWSHPDGQPLLTLDRPSTNKVDALDLSPDQTLLATGGLRPGTTGVVIVDLWSFPQGTRLSTLTVQVHGYSASPVMFAPEGGELLVGTRLFKVADLLKGDTPADGGYADTDGQGAFSPDGRYVASGGRVVERLSGKVLFDQSGGAEAFWPDSTRYLLGRALYHIDPVTFVKLRDLEEQVVSRAHFTADGQRLLLDIGVAEAGHVDGPRFRFRRLPELTLERTFSLGPVGEGPSVVSADGKRIARSLYGSVSETLYWVSDATTGRTVSTFRRPRPPIGIAAPNLMGLSEDGSLIVTDTEVLDAASGAVRLASPVRRLSPSGRLVIAYDASSKSYVSLELPALVRIGSRIPSTDEPVAISHDDRHVLTVPRSSALYERGSVPERKTATLIEVATGARFTLRGWMGDLAWGEFTLDGRHLVARTFRNGIQLLRLEDRTVIPNLPSSEEFAVSPDGRHLAVGSRGGSVRILRVDQSIARRHPGRPRAQPERHAPRRPRARGNVDPQQRHREPRRGGDSPRVVRGPAVGGVTTSPLHHGHTGIVERCRLGLG